MILLKALLLPNVIHQQHPEAVSFYNTLLLIIFLIKKDVVLEKVELTKEQSEAMGGAQYAVTPVRKFGIRPKNANKELLEEVEYPTAIVIVSL